MLLRHKISPLLSLSGGVIFYVLLTDNKSEPLIIIIFGSPV